MEALLERWELLLALFLLVLGFVAGRYLESRHFRNIRERETKFLHQPAVTFKVLRDSRPVESTQLALGSVVVSADYYKRFLMGFRKLFGGEIRSYSPLLDRGRREAVLRLKESCPDADLYLNLQLSTSSIHGKQAKSMGCVEVLATATAVRFRK